MLETARDSFAQLLKLGDARLNQALLAALAERNRDTNTTLFAANLLRRSGDLPGARAEFAKLGTGGGDASTGGGRDWPCIPANNWSNGGFAIAPLVIIDDFLPVERMQALHRHACEREGEFRAALATNEGAEPSYDPDRRQSLLDYKFTLEREFFGTFISQNLQVLQHGLGLPEFSVDRCELKLTNHVDGGFFRIHADNHAAFADAGRAITWLYYFADEGASFSGGELLVLDSCPDKSTVSPAWFSKVIPLANRFVAFPSAFYHAVTPLSHVGGFARGRFAVSGHIRKRADNSVAWWEIENLSD